ncbi:MAG TPA: lytic transglycosylase domain-containing protein, partial [Chitinispirillaceae bacterium]|nr:lytic transglycosylase domain-containing protein [Chitinispirillaceae bacterium]
MASLWCLLAPFFLFYAFVYGGSTLFPVPENLKNNVKFWIRIYTELSQDQGLLHDSEFPLIVYETVNTGGIQGRESGRNLESLRKEIISAIIKVRTGKRSTWGAIEKRIDSLFYSNPGSRLDSAEYRVRFQRGQKDQFLRGLYRSGAYIDTIKAILTRYGLPSELAYLPHVESSFDPFITSKVGAVGIWQFMPATAKQFLLRVDRSVDERRDPILSTDAAARVLSRNYRHLKNWPLAITAYNYGLPGMLRAVEAAGSNDPGVVIDKHKSPSFRFASRNFYSCFLAALEVAENYRKYFGEIEFEGRMSVRDIFLSQDLSPVQIARILGITTDEFFLLNPGMSKDLRQVSKGTTIRVFDTFTSETLEQRIAYYYDSVSAGRTEPVADIKPVTVETITVSVPVFDADIYDFALRQTGS